MRWAVVSPAGASFNHLPRRGMRFEAPAMAVFALLADPFELLRRLMPVMCFYWKILRSPIVRSQMSCAYRVLLVHFESVRILMAISTENEETQGTESATRREGRKAQRRSSGSSERPLHGAPPASPHGMPAHTPAPDTAPAAARHSRRFRGDSALKACSARTSAVR